MTSIAAGASISSEFFKPTLVFEVTVANDDTVMRHLKKLGIRSRPRGSFRCLTESTTLISLADYPISFAVERSETLTDAVPMIRLAPGSSATFTVSLYPHATGACGPWSSDVNVIMVFDDGTRLENPAATITDRDLEERRIRNPQRDEVLAGLRHRNFDLRLQSLRQLAKVGLDRVTLEEKVRLAFQDPDGRIRSEAYAQVASLKLHALIPELIKRFERIPLRAQPRETRQADSAELLALCRSFTMLPAEGAEDGVLAVLTHTLFIYPEPLGEVLKQIRTPAMPGKLMQALDAHRAWAAALPDIAANPESPKLATRYDILLRTLIDYRDIRSVPLLKSLMVSPQDRRTARVILTSVLQMTDANHRVQNPFVLAFRDVVRGLVRDPWGDDRENLREPAMLLSVRTAEDPAEQAALLQAGLRDRSPYVQLSAAQEAATLRLISMAPQILKSYRASNTDLQPSFCKALTELGAKCREQGASL